MNHRLVRCAPLLCALFIACGDTKEPSDPVTFRIVKAADVEWQMLNPLRGDKSPKAGTLWGDRGAPVPCGFLVKFIDGFSSPPHIHPVTYRGVVVTGEVHNDLPDAEKEWLPPGTFWTQPAGEVHITAAKGSTNVAYIEIEKGPYLVKPAAEAFTPPETPIKMPPSKMDWKGNRAALAGNPGDDTLTRTLVRVPAGSSASITSDGAELHLVVITGQLTHGEHTLDAGSYFGSTGKATHEVKAGDAESLVYVRTRGTFELVSK